jgi:tRNA(Ile)-lysidine synthase
MVLLHLLLDTNYELAVAHCNFGLRGEESEADATFVMDYCEYYNVSCYMRSFNTIQYAGEHNMSVQMAARELRYRWFEELRNKISFDYIAVAHNLDDVVETVFINLARGTGIKGITGMKNKTGVVIRPLLFASRKEIEQYASNKEIPFREDSSNISVKYKRNRIRHNIIPEFEKLNPSFLSTMNENLDRFSEIDGLVKKYIDNEKKRVVDIREGDRVCIDILKLKNSETPKNLLHEIMKPYGFSPAMVPEMLNSQPGKLLFSSTHELLKDRDCLIIRKKQLVDDLEVQLNESTKYIETPVKMEIKFLEKDEHFNVSTRKSTAEVDADKLRFPLRIRRWKEGDYFYPLGMKGRKKLSDFFTDNKFTKFDKETCWLLVSDEEIVWIIGHRLDDRFKITENTTRICRFKLL